MSATATEQTQASEQSTKQQDPQAKPGQQQQQQQSAGYSVARAQGRCHVCGETIEADQKLMAALRETPQGFERLDVSMTCWATFERGPDILAFWQTVMPRHEQKKKLFVDDEVLCSLFERLSDTTEPAKLNFRFVLGLILMRKRMIVYESSRNEEDGKEIWSVRFKGREDKLDLVNPKLDEQQVMEVSQQLGEILNEEI